MAKQQREQTIARFRSEAVAQFNRDVADGLRRREELGEYVAAYLHDEMAGAEFDAAWAEHYGHRSCV